MKLYRSSIKQKTRPFYFEIRHKYSYILSCRIYDEPIWRLARPTNPELKYHLRISLEKAETSSLN